MAGRLLPRSPKGARPLLIAGLTAAALILPAGEAFAGRNVLQAFGALVERRLHQVARQLRQPQFHAPQPAKAAPAVDAAKGGADTPAAAGLKAEAAPSAVAAGDKIRVAPPAVIAKDKAAVPDAETWAAAKKRVVPDFSEADGAAVPLPRERPNGGLAYGEEDLPPLPPVRPKFAAAAALAAGNAGRMPPAAAGAPAPTPPVRIASLPPDAGVLPAAKRGAPLVALGVVATSLAAIEESACGFPDPVAVAALDNGAVSFSPKATVNTRIAATLAAWVQSDVEPAARAIFGPGADLTSLRIAASYDCRTRDRIKDAKLSEHAFGNAIDIGAFRIGRRWIEIGNKANSADDERFLAEVRRAACARFTTVLGPGQPYHDEHFHLDLGQHGKSGTYRICE
jgi:hypothetical protein